MNSKIKKTFTDPWYFLALGLGSGLSRWAPGTMGSLVAIPLYFVIQPLEPLLYLAVVVVAIIFGIWLCERVARDMEVKDPASIVWDEFVGIWITLFMLPDGWYWLLAGFLLFRLFDIAKPWPVSWLDKNLTGGVGIMMDDVAAGLYSLAIIQSAAFAMSYL